MVTQAQTPSATNLQQSAVLTATQPSVTSTATPPAVQSTPSAAMQTAVLTTTSPVLTRSSAPSPLALYKAATRVVNTGGNRELRNFTYQSQPAEITGISNSRKFDGDSKVPFPYTKVTSYPDCRLVPIKMKTSVEDFGLFFPARTFKEGIFPGAVYPFLSLRNQSPTAYTRFTNRNQMDLTIKIFDDRAVTGNGPATIATFDAGTLSRQFPTAIAKYSGGANALPATTEIFTVESNKQMNAMLHTGAQIDFATRINIPIPDIAMNISQFGVSPVTAIIPRKMMRNTVLLCFRQVYYTASLAVKSGKQDLFPDVNNSQLEPDLVYVQGVDYGQVFYVTVSSEYSKAMLYGAVRNKTGAYTALGLLPSSFPDNGTLLTRQELTLSEGETNRLLNDPSTSIACFQYDGQAVSMGTTIDEVLTNLAAKVKKRFNSNTEAVPVSYSLNYAADHSPVWFNSEVCYAAADCGTREFRELKYTVKMKLVKAEVVKAVEGGADDKCEELYGQMRVGKMVYSDYDAISISRKSNDFIWRKDGLPLDYVNACQGFPISMEAEKEVAKDLGFSAIEKGQFLLTQFLFDAEVLLPIKYDCKEGVEEIMIKLNAYLKQIESMPGGSAPLSIPIVYNFFEGGKVTGSHVKIYWELKIKAI